jgi:hypothetical protein
VQPVLKDLRVFKVHKALKEHPAHKEILEWLV